MKQIKIGTCVPGTKAEEWLKGFAGKGFETFSINFHMSLEELTRTAAEITLYGLQHLLPQT